MVKKVFNEDDDYGFDGSDVVVMCGCSFALGAMFILVVLRLL